LTVAEQILANQEIGNSAAAAALDILRAGKCKRKQEL